MSNPSSVRFVLVEPRSGGNVGATARALANLGFSRLSLVRPHCDPRGAEARMMAVDAAGMLDAAELHDELDAAVGGAGAVIGTTGRTGKHRRPHYRLDELAPEILRLASARETAVLFGREDRGLTDRELDRCTHLVYLPAAEIYSSFNLAQSVLLVAYELRRAALEPIAGPPEEAPAKHDARESMYAHLQQALLDAGFLHATNVEAIMRRFRRLFGRAAVTDDEVRMLRGLARQIRWVAARDEADRPDGDARS